MALSGVRWSFRASASRVAPVLVAWAAALLCGAAGAQDADALKARHAALETLLAGKPFGRPLHVESTDASGEHAGEIYALIDKPFGVVGPALSRARDWCDVLILPANVKQCEVSRSGREDELALHVAKSATDSLEQAFKVDFKYTVAASREDYLRVALHSEDGPFGTRDYEIRLEAAPVEAKRTFVHMSYSYGLGLLARIAMEGYLATSGRGKVGFSVVDRGPDGKPVYVDGMRGVIERNAMRYYLAIEAYLDSLGAPPGERLDARLRDWYAAIERYPLQLKEPIGRAKYLELKRSEAQRSSVGGS